MDFEKSSQRRRWTIDAAQAAWRSEDEQKTVARCIAHIYKTLPKCGLGNPRRAFISAAHYFHRYCVVEAIESHERPELVAMACLFIAGKTEEIPWPRYTHGSLQNRGFTARNMCSADPNLSMEELVEVEREVLHVLDFYLVVLQPKSDAAEGSNEELKETVSFMTSRACLMHSPTEMSSLASAIDLAGMSEYLSLVT